MSRDYQVVPEVVESAEEKKKRQQHERKQKSRAKLKRETITADLVAQKIEATRIQHEKEMKMTITEWWEFNRRSLTPQQREQLAARQEQVFDSIHWANAWVQGTYAVKPEEIDYYVSWEDGLDIIKEDIKIWGQLHADPENQELWYAYREEEMFREEVKSWGNPVYGELNASQIFYRFHYLVGIPNKTYSDVGRLRRTAPEDTL